MSKSQIIKSLAAVPGSPRVLPCFKADKEQRRHLLIRIDTYAQTLDTKLRRRNTPEPPEVVEARRVIDAWEDAESEKYDEQKSGLDRLRLWLRERVLFDDVFTALSLAKQFECMDLDAAMQSGGTMEDRNDTPLLGFQANV